MFGVAIATTLTNTVAEIQVEGVCTVPKASGVQISDGDALYLDSNNTVTNINTTDGLPRAGTAWGDAGTSEATVDMKLMGGQTINIV